MQIWVKMLVGVLAAGLQTGLTRGMTTANERPNTDGDDNHVWTKN